MNSILTTNNVIKYYGSGVVITKALDGVSIELNKGEFTAIMGPSGSGKSTLLNVIATIDKVSAGEITIDGIKLSDMNEKQLAAFRRDKLGFVFQEYNLLDTLTVEENIALPLNLKKLSDKAAAKRVKEIAEKLGVSEQLLKFPSELSGGQRQRVACARAIITDPALVLADEPTGALDSHTSKSLMNTFSLMNSELSTTILMVTHDATVGSYANRVLFLRDGKIISEVYKGDRDRREMRNDILSVMASLGGDIDVY